MVSFYCVLTFMKITVILLTVSFVISRNTTLYSVQSFLYYNNNWTDGAFVQKIKNGSFAYFSTNKYSIVLMFSQTFLCFKMLKKILTPFKGVTEHLEFNYNFPSFTEVETHVECVFKYYVYECPLTNIYSNLVPR